MKIICRTLFDCSYTGVVGYFRPSAVPFTDKAGQLIKNQTSWYWARNQQRNWETLTQIIGLRTQPLDISYPVVQEGMWEFNFIAEADGVYGIVGNVDPLAALRQDCVGIPMIVNLDEQFIIDSAINIEGLSQNIWFEIVSN